MKLKKGDLFIIVILVTAVLGWFLKDAIFPDDSSKNAVIKIDGQVYATIPLDKDNERQEIPLTLADNQYMRIVTEKDQIWVEKSTCPDEVCIKTGKIRKPGQSIVCLPNKTVIHIEGAEDMDIDDLSV